MKLIERRLDALNFFLADVRGGLGAFVSVFLVSAAGWTPGEIGAVLTVSGLLGIAFHTPIGALIDATAAKRWLIVVAVVLLAICAVAIERSPSGPVVFAADVTMAVLGGVFAPTVAALTLGLVADRDLPRRLARNAVFDRIGNVSIATLIGVMGWWFSQAATFYLIPVFAALSAWVVLGIPQAAIDQDRARGFTARQIVRRPQSAWQLLTQNKSLALLALIAAAFHFANAAMLPLVGQKLALAHPGFETALMSACILISQLVTIPVALYIGARTGVLGQKALLAAACTALTMRGLAFAWFDNPFLLVGAQILDGVAAGIWDVILPLMLAEFVAGSGRYSMSRGVVGTVQGVGGSLSNVVAGTIVNWAGYGVAFAVLAAVAVASLALVALLSDPERAGTGRLAVDSDLDGLG